MAATIAEQTRPRLRRDGVTWLLYAQLSIFAFFLYGFTPSVTLLRDNEGVSDAVAGLHGTFYAAGVVGAGLVASRFLARIGRSRGLWLFLAVLAAGVLIYVSVPLLPVTLFGALVLGVAGSGVPLTTGAALADHHGPSGPAALAEANGIAAALGVLAPLAVGAFVHWGYGWRVALLIAPALIGVLFLTRRLFGPPLTDPLRRPDAVPVSDFVLVDDGAGVAGALVDRPGPADNRPAGRRDPLGPQFRLSCTIVVLCVAVEFCMTLWCAQLLRERAGLSVAAAATGVTAVVGGMSVGRFLTTRIAARRDVDWILARAFALTGLGFAVFWLSRDGVLSFAGLALCGLGMATHYPLGIARAIRTANRPGAADAHRSNRASAIVSVGTGVAIGLAPFVLGFLADAVGIRLAFLLVPALLLAAAATLLVAHRWPGTRN